MLYISSDFSTPITFQILGVASVIDKIGLLGITAGNPATSTEVLVRSNTVRTATPLSVSTDTSVVPISGLSKCNLVLTP